MKNPFEVLVGVVKIGGSLGIDESGALRVRVPRTFPPSLKNSIQRHKLGLVELLRRNFLLVRSEVLKTTVIWTPDDQTKEALISAGAGGGYIYTSAELAYLINGGVASDELPLIHEAKQKFSGKLTKPPLSVSGKPLKTATTRGFPGQVV